MLVGTTCTCQLQLKAQRHDSYDRYHRDKKSKGFYNSAEWRRVKEMVLNRDSMDVYIYMTEGRVLAADTVHHITPLKDDWNRRLDMSNLMSLNASTHSMIETEYKKDKQQMIKKLSEMLQKFRELTVQGAI